MKKIVKRLALLCGVLLLLTGIAFGLFYTRFVIEAPEPDYPIPKNRTEAQEQDLDYLAQYVDTDKSFDTPEKRTAFFEQLDRLRSKIPLAAHEFRMGVAKVAAQADNTHTNVSPSLLSRQSNAIPLRFYWFGTDLHVVLAQAPYQTLLGAKITAINGQSPADILQKLDAWYGGSTNRLKFQSPLYFMSPELLQAVHCGSSRNSITLTYQTEDQSEQELTLEATDLGKDEVGYWPPNWLNRERMQSKEGWHVLPFQGKVALPFRHTQSNVTHSLLDRGLYVQLNENANSKEIGTDAYLDQVLQEVEQQPLDYAILDLRFNPGGDYHIGRSFIEVINKRLNGKPFYIITGHATFSAGIMSAAIAKHTAGSNCIIIGEEVGDRLQFWADGGSSMTLPNSKIRLRIWTAYHDWANGCTDWDKCFWITIFDGVGVGDLDLDLPVSLSFSDYEGGADSVLQAIVRLEE